jgi:hypothetical protein
MYQGLMAEEFAHYILLYPRSVINTDIIGNDEQYYQEKYFTDFFSLLN